MGIVDSNKRNVSRSSGSLRGADPACDDEDERWRKFETAILDALARNPLTTLVELAFDSRESRALRLVND
jgi:hypothetical protein